MTKQERLVLYKLALKDYIYYNTIVARLFLEKEKKQNYLHYGFCSYFPVNLHVNFNEDNFPELWKQRPGDFDRYSFWWPKGKLSPRIKALQAAIDLCKN